MKLMSDPLENGVSDIFLFNKKGVGDVPQFHEAK